MRITLAALALLFSTLFASAADLSPAQLQTLKSDINANFLAAWNAQQVDTIVAAYNADATPTFVVWRTTVPAEEYRDAITWTELTGRSAGERDMFSFLTANGSMALNCSRGNVRQAIADAFSGAAGVNSRTAILAACKRAANRVERLYVTGTGTDATPGRLVFEGTISAGDVLAAMGN